MKPFQVLVLCILAVGGGLRRWMEALVAMFEDQRRDGQWNRAWGSKFRIDYRVELKIEDAGPSSSVPHAFSNGKPWLHATSRSLVCWTSSGCYHRRQKALTPTRETTGAARRPIGWQDASPNIDDDDDDVQVLLSDVQESRFNAGDAEYKNAPSSGLISGPCIKTSSSCCRMEKDDVNRRNNARETPLHSSCVVFGNSTSWYGDSYGCIGWGKDAARALGGWRGRFSRGLGYLITKIETYYSQKFSEMKRWATEFPDARKRDFGVGLGG
ncbi:hypothetical protein LY76DRAFT_665101 [Colletotrichum caudatum]|nr:hypothetical protein LY76DRAFT_665101 [Colletotrichum caudatum]